MKELFDKVSVKSSKYLTRIYSTSFSLGIRFLAKELRDPVYSIYGFVRLGDEIVDTFHTYDKKSLLDGFRKEVYDSIQNKISINPILNSFQYVVNKFNIDIELIDSFIYSMDMDLNATIYDVSTYQKYILGSAEVVGLMCLKVFCSGDQKKYEELKGYAMKLGSAYQKVNFLRDMHSDYIKLGRTYFPDLDMNQFNDDVKKKIEEDIEKDFQLGYEGISKLPKKARFGVYLSFIYYWALFNKIKRIPSDRLLNERIRISDSFKYYLLLKSSLKYNLSRL